MRARAALLAAVMVTFFLGRAGMAQERELALSILPFDALGKEEQTFTLLADYLTRELKRQVYFEPAMTYDGLLDALQKRKIDIAFVGAVLYLEARRHGDVRAVARTVRRGKPFYRGAIFVKTGSPITGLAGLKGKKIAFVDRLSTSGHLFPRLVLAAAGLDPAKDLSPTFAGSHDSALRLLARGAVDAAACLEDAPRSLPDAGMAVPIAFTQEIPSDPVMVRAGLGTDLVEALRRALVKAAADPSAAKFLARARIDGFVPTADGDYDEVDRIVSAQRLREASGLP